MTPEQTSSCGPVTTSTFVPVSSKSFTLISLGFADKFNTAQPASRGLSSGDELPVITVSKGSEELDLALCHCYPTRSPVLDDWQDAHVFLNFAQKYQADALNPR